MSDLMKLIQEADVASVAFEQTRHQVEAAKLNLETAKVALDEARSALEEIVSRADDLGIPRGKVRKLIEERTQALMASGLISGSGDQKITLGSKPPRATRKIKNTFETEKEDFMSSVGAELQSAELN